MSTGSSPSAEPGAKPYRSARLRAARRRQFEERGGRGGGPAFEAAWRFDKLSAPSEAEGPED